MADTPTPVGTSAGGPIFIVGPMGSGTTLLRLIVDSHDNLAIAQETSIMRAYLAHKWIPFHRHGGAWYGRLGWSDEELEVRLRDFYSGMFERFAAEQGKGRWGDKTPWHVWHLREISRLFPESVVIGTVRHPGAVASSVSGRFRLSWGSAVSHWVNTTTEMVQRAAELGDRFLLCRYEDLVTSTETTLREVFDWLGEPWSPRLLEHHVVHSERGTPRRVEGTSRSDEPIDPERMFAWSEDRSDDEMAVLRERTSALAGFYGYDAVDHKHLTGISVAGSPRTFTLTGSELARRRGQFPELREQLDKEMTASIANRMITPETLGIVTKAVRSRRKRAAAAEAAAAAAAAAEPVARPSLVARTRRGARRVIARMPGSSGTARR